jgi:hypothetical protein
MVTKENCYHYFVETLGYNNAANEQEFFDIAIAQAETEAEPDRVADDLDREAMGLIAVNGWCVHAPSMAHQASARQAAQ